MTNLPSIEIVIRKDATLIHYDKVVEQLDLGRFGDCTVHRLSHIDPAPGGKTFQVLWTDFARRLGITTTVDYCDDFGNVFRTKTEAETYELQRLARDVYKTTPPDTKLLCRPTFKDGPSDAQSTSGVGSDGYGPQTGT